MKEKDIFQGIRRQKNKFSLKTRLTLLVGAVVFVSIGFAFGVSKLMEAIFPNMSEVPLLMWIGTLSLIITMVATRFLSKRFFDPIKKLCEGMQRVADGDFTTRLETRSTSYEFREMMAGFNMMVQELQSTEILQSDFVSNVSHEFKTPINAIEGYTTLLQNAENIDEAESEYIEKILFNTHRLSSLVSNILLLSKIENQTIQTHKEIYALDEQIREDVLSLEPEWSQKKIEFDIELETVSYYGNESMMHHVWSNLIGNAIKFSPSGGEIKIRLHQDHGQIVFYVEDDGPGISDESKKHIFDKFYQEDTSHKGEGNGLGLALVKRIVALTGGSITAENIPDKGCRFTVSLLLEHEGVLDPVAGHGAIGDR